MAPVLCTSNILQNMWVTILAYVFFATVSMETSKTDIRGLVASISVPPGYSS